MPSASVLIVARSAPAALLAQLQSLVEADLGDTEIVVVADQPTVAVTNVLRSLEGITLHASSQLLGRRAALGVAAHLATGEVCIALSQTARATPGFVAPLADAVAAGAALAVPVIDAHGRAVHGYDVAEDGSAWPRPADAPGAPGAVALDCLAAPPSFFLDVLPNVVLDEGLEEVALTAAAARIGRVEVVPASVVRRATVGPPATVIVASRDRASEIGPCVRALVAHGVLDAGGEIVVADNGSTDGTDDVLAELMARHGDGLRVVREPRPGASVARNTAARTVTSEVICLIDDDARPAPAWFEHLRDAFAEPEVAVAGGPVRGLFPADRDPDWPGQYGGYVSVLDLGSSETVRDPVRQPVYGANWAMRTDVWRAGGGLPEDLGVTATRKINGEETALEILVHRRGLGECRWTPGASVGHRIGGDRLNETYLQLRSFRCGAETLRVLGHSEPVGEQRMRRDAANKLGIVFSVVALPGDCDVDEAYAAIVGSGASFAQRMRATFALGSVTCCARGLRQWRWTMPDGVVLTVRPEHAEGHVRVPVTAVTG